MPQLSIPPEYVNIPAGMLYDQSLPPAVIHTYCQLRGLAWRDYRGWLDEIPINQIIEITGKSRSTLYGHLAVLRGSGWLLFNTTRHSGLTFRFCEPDAAHEIEASQSRYLDSLNEEVKESFKELLLPEVNDSLSPEQSEYLDEQSKYLDGRRFFDQGLLIKLEQIGVWPKVVRSLEEKAVRDGWTLEKLHLLADQLIRDKGMQNAGQLFAYRIKERIMPKTGREKQEEDLNYWRREWDKSQNMSVAVEGETAWQF